MRDRRAPLDAAIGAGEAELAASNARKKQNIAAGLVNRDPHVGEERDSPAATTTAKNTGDIADKLDALLAAVGGVAMQLGVQAAKLPSK